VDTHLDVNVVAVLDGIGGLLGVESFPTSPAGNRAVLVWLKILRDDCGGGRGGDRIV
jgi:hypothetical protein